MSKSKKPKHIKKKGPLSSTVKPQKAVEKQSNISPKRDYSKQIGYVGLVIVLIFSCFLRYENFSVWKDQKATFQYQNEYQMSNFDSYYYLRLAKDIQDGTYDVIDTKRQIPNAKKRPKTPPLLSVITASISSATGIQLASVAIFMPVFLSALLALMVFLLCLRLKLHTASALLAALFSAISLTYVARTRVGVFDTDSLNVVFPLVNSYLCYLFIQSQKKFKYKYLVFAILNTLLYLTWWNTASSVVVLSLIIPLSVTILFFYITPKPAIKFAILGVILLGSLFFVKDQAIALLELVLGSKTTAFPNNMDISELDSVGLGAFIDKSLNNSFLAILSLIGLGYFGYKHKLKALILALPLLLAFTPFMAGNRFIAFSAPIMGLAIGHFTQIMFDKKQWISPIITSLIAVFIAMVGVFSTYNTITDKYQPPAAYENTQLLTILKNNTPEKANIWTDADLGYQIQYYLDRGTYADGEFEDGELRYYLYYPLVSQNLSLSANFMKFYNTHGMKGLQDLYTHFPSIPATFDFLGQVLTIKPAEARILLEQKKQEGLLPKIDTLPTTDEWLAYLYPQNKEDIYLFLYYKMTQTASWFKQGNADLKTGETKGLPLFLALNGLKEKGGLVQNDQIKIDTASGRALYMNGTKHSFQYLLSYKNGDAKRLSYNSAGKLIPIGKRNSISDKRFAFQWNKQNRFGVALSREMGETAFVQLYLQNKGNEYFEAVDLRAPMYQIWKVNGDVYKK